MFRFLASILLFMASSSHATQLSYSIDELTVSAGQPFTVPDNAKKIAISKLTMQKGARIIIPPGIEEFEFVIDSGIFFSNASIQSVGKSGAGSDGIGQKGGNGLSGSRIVFKVNHAKFEFDPTTTSTKPEYFSIPSVGGIGGTGGPGAKGGDARTSNCNSSGNGHPASIGSPGAVGGDGGVGNEILASVKLIKNHPIITDKEIQLMSIGGDGGAGGVGGQGGGGSPTVCCQKVFGECLMRRGGNSAAGPGSVGSKGEAGGNRAVKLNLSFEDT